MPEYNDNIRENAPVLFITNIGAFYSKLYDIKKHPYYPLMYDSWNPKQKQYYYSHNGNKEEKINSVVGIMKELGFEDCEEIPSPEIEELTDEELKTIDVLDDMAMLSDLVSSKKA